MPFAAWNDLHQIAIEINVNGEWQLVDVKCEIHEKACL